MRLLVMLSTSPSLPTQSYVEKAEKTTDESKSVVVENPLHAPTSRAPPHPNNMRNFINYLLVVERP